MWEGREGEREGMREGGREGMMTEGERGKDYHANVYDSLLLLCKYYLHYKYIKLLLGPIAF